MLPLIGRHTSHGADGAVEGTPPLRRQVAELAEQLSRVLLLLPGEVLPGFHAVQHALLLFWRKIIEALQALPQLLLPLRRQIAKLRVIFERFPLLGWR